MFEPEHGDAYGNNELEVQHLDVAQLLTLRAEIDARLPAVALKDLNLETEIVLQYQTAKALQTSVLGGNDEANKKAQTLNSCAAALQACIKMQTEYHTAERFKVMEGVLIQTLKDFPEVSELFLADYERALGALK